MRFSITALLLLVTFQLVGQEKREYETRTQEEQVPVNARQWLAETFPPIRKKKWYFEQTSGKQSYEAKFSQRGQRYSVEFNVDGTIEDIEIERKLRKLPSDIQAALKKGFDAIPKIRVKRIQEQWTGTEQQLQNAVKTGSTRAIVVRFEIEFTGILDQAYQFWEGTFTKDGQLISYRRIMLRPSDNLDF